MVIRIRIEGFEELEQLMRTMPADISKRPIATKTLRSAAKPLIELIKSNTPVLTGGLQRSVVSGVRLSRAAKRYHAADLGTDKKTVWVHVGPTKKIVGIHVEHGTEDTPQIEFMRKS